MTGKIGRGARAHEVEILKSRTLNGQHWFQATCSCGWRGKEQMRRAEAEGDELAHMEAQDN